MVPQWIIEKKRDGGVLDEQELRFLIQGYTRGEIPDYQMAALAMAIYFQGMTFEETATLTDLMMRSGALVDTSFITRPKADKHSTGGIGDKVSLILAPLVACCGVAVPMISGRGLGITGGTLDKMEAIPGYRCDLSEQEFIDVVDRCGCSIIGQTAELAPADKKLYALRDVTGTVPSIPLITASIMCKKMAEGIDALVLDVKYGRGAFMKTMTQARTLATNMVEVGRCMGKQVTAVITDMNEPLGHCVGNALEVRESIDCLRGEGPPDLMDVTLVLSARMLLMTGVARDDGQTMALLREKIASGDALRKFAEMIALQHGDPAVIDDPKLMPRAACIQNVETRKHGYVDKVNAETIGKAALLLGAGRVKTSDTVDHAVGIAHLAKTGCYVRPGDRLAELHANDQGKLAEAATLVEHAFSYSSEPVTMTNRIHDVIGAEGGAA